MNAEPIYCTACGTSNEPDARFCYKCGKPIKGSEPALPVRAASDFISLSCPNCGGKLEITPDMERFSCKFCGTEHLVRRSGGAVSLAPVVEGLKRVETKFDQVLTGSDRMAAEQTIQRLKNETRSLEQQIQEKQGYLKSITPQKSLYTLGVLFMAFAVLAYPLGSHVLYYKIYNFINHLLFNTPFFAEESQFVGWSCVIFCVLIAVILISSSKVKPLAGKKKAADLEEKTRAELEQLKTELQERRQQLAQLNRYTTER
ncbi:protein containg zinc-ribbon domain [Longilinea arvoryzae]|uniref:Protein containg zinc-ribbon domain n=1 Tax=Longilinea arvoryzae TaxID=360412 RepID=A0A0S7BG89_9CHLR|nr:zinc ribbon domain-containing protein [Longilinea arvoryzae]GAP12709.1 protein containg zinc-ribbon domain [Longilinea arvoryzae]